MNNYKTIIGKADEWNVSKRHVQYLCKTEKIKGAIKIAGVWYIPDDAPVPVKNTKTGTPNFKFVGTKKKIFEKSIELFILHGFENVSAKKISTEVGIKQSTIYNHFKTKQEILDAIYDYYCCYLINWMSMEEIEETLQNGSLMDIMMCTRYKLKEEHKQKIVDISKIVFQRNSIDDRAKEIMNSLILDNGISSIETIFRRAVEIGRLAPMDTRAMAVFINSIRISMLHIWMINPSPETIKKAADDEKQLYQYATKLLTDLKSPSKSSLRVC